MNEAEARNTIFRLKMEAEGIERQMKADRLMNMGFKGWDSPELKNGDSIITVRKDFSYGFIPSLSLRDLTFYDMSWWIRPEDLRPSDLETIKKKMMYPCKRYLIEYLENKN